MMTEDEYKSKMDALQRDHAKMVEESFTGDWLKRLRAKTVMVLWASWDGAPAIRSSSTSLSVGMTPQEAHLTVSLLLADKEATFVEYLTNYYRKHGVSTKVYPDDLFKDDREAIEEVIMSQYDERGGLIS